MQQLWKLPGWREEAKTSGDLRLRLSYHRCSYCFGDRTTSPTPPFTGGSGQEASRARGRSARPGSQVRGHSNRARLASSTPQTQQRPRVVCTYPPCLTQHTGESVALVDRVCHPPPQCIPLPTKTELLLLLFPLSSTFSACVHLRTGFLSRLGIVHQERKQLRSLS